MTIRIRVNFGCGSIQPNGWINIDNDTSFAPTPRPATFLADDVLEGLVIEERTVDYVVAHHSFQQIGHHELPAAFRELRRCLKWGGVLRISVPDVVGAVLARNVGDRAWFPNAVDRPEVPLDVVLSEYLTWFGTARTCFTYAYLEDRLRAGGFQDVAASRFGSSAFSDDPGICALDSRAAESIWVEARR